MEKVTKEMFEQWIDELCKLENGWYDRSQGGTYKKENFDLLKEKLFKAHDELTIPLPILYPCIENDTIRLEWWECDLDLDLGLDLNLKTNKITYLSIDGFDDEEFDFDKQWDFILTTMWETI